MLTEQEVQAMFQIKAKDLGHFDVAVCGAGIAGVSAAVSAARAGANVVLIEKSGSMGGTLTEGYVAMILDGVNKGGIIRELYAFLNARQMTCAKLGKKAEADGTRIPGCVIDVEGAKYFFDDICRKAGVHILFHSQVAGISMQEDSINALLVASECGNYSLSADIYIDATGNGIVADFAGCEWECGDPIEKRPSPASMEVCAVGLPAAYDGTDSFQDKSAYAHMLLGYGIDVSAQQATIKKLPNLQTWFMGVNFQYDVMPDDIKSLTDAVLEGRKEAFDVIERHKTIPGYEALSAVLTSPHIGIREGRRVYGQYRLSDDDILAGRKFDDGICLVTFGVDVHKLKPDDTIECGRGYHTKPYHIPYRCLVARDCINLMLAGRCISGDFYPHASYRVVGNMAATGEAAGFAAANCVKEKILPCEFDGTRVSAYMRSLGYAL